MNAINWHTFFFLLFSLIACGFAVAVVVASNIVRMAFCLILSLGAVAGLYFLAGADFVAAMQLMIYVGGTLVLLVFGVMLTAQGPFVSLKITPANWVMALLIGGALFVLLVGAACSVPAWTSPPVATAAHATESQYTVTPIGMGLLGVRVDQFRQPDPPARRGMAGYLLPFEIVSVHLLVVLIGAAHLARAKRRADSQEGVKKQLP